MSFWQALQIPKGVTAVTGSGGKTTLLHTLAAELPGRVVLCTTTKMFPSPVYPTLYDPKPEELWAAGRAVCVGAPAENGKLGPCRSIPIGRLRELADYVLVEADGARGLPLKAHAPWEPVIPPEAVRVICVVGASGFGRPKEQAVHRPELWRPADTSPAAAAEMLALEGGWDAVFVNQCDGPVDLERARTLASALSGRPVWAGSLKKGEIQCW